jgi:hypothetical protein
MRDLRSLVSVSDGARDEASRELVVTLRELLERRVEEHRVSWANDVAKNLDQGQVVRALRLSGRPPDATTRFSAELATRLRDAASSALSSAAPADQWLAVLEAVIESPVRRTVKPAGLPANPNPELLATARKHCGQVPGLAPLLGIRVPPPPGPVGPSVPLKAPPRRPPRPPKPARPAGAGRPAHSASATAAPAAPGATTSAPTTPATTAASAMVVLDNDDLAVAQDALDQTSVEAASDEAVAQSVADVLAREMPAELLGNELAVDAAEPAYVRPPATGEFEPGGPEVSDDAYDAADLAVLDEVHDTPTVLDNDETPTVLDEIDPSPAGEPAAR